MGKIAFVFSGQGDQYPGMGKQLFENYPAAASVYKICDAIRPGTSSQCFEGSEEELKETKNTQPCLFAMELSALAVLKTLGISPDVTAGFSSGEIAAATAAGIFNLETGFQLACKRGELMQQEAEKFDTFMAAVIKLTPEQLQDICQNYSDLYPVNFNCPGQITVSGLTSQLADFSAEVRAAKGRVLPLKVKGAFHSPFMKHAADAFAKELKKTEINKPNIVLYSNMTAKPYTDEVIPLLSGQIKNPVQWENSIRQMIADGVDTFIEIGPGKTLTNMIQKISSKVQAKTVLEYLSEVTSC